MNQTLRSSTSQLGSGRLISHTATLRYGPLSGFIDPDFVNIQHDILRSLLRGIFAAPLRSPLAIMDVGCNTGQWAIEMAQNYPNANIIGIDTRDLYHYQTPLPENYIFIQADILGELPFAGRLFDFVNQRFQAMNIPRDRWQGVVQEMTRVTATSGWVELAEMGVAYGAPAVNQLSQWMSMLLSQYNVDIDIAAHLDTLLQDAGLAHIRIEMFTIPIGKFGGHVSRWCAENLRLLFQRLREPILTARIATTQAFDTAIAQFQAELQTTHCVAPLYAAFGQRTF